MKQFAMTSLIAVSGLFAMVGMTQAVANTSPTTTTVTSVASQNNQTVQTRRMGGGINRAQYGGPGRMGVMADRWASLNLTEAQKSQIQALRESNRAQYQTGNRLSVEERQARRQQMHEEITKILTPEQRAQFEKIQAECEVNRGTRGMRRNAPQ